MTSHLSLTVAVLALATPALAQSITNPGFEYGWSGWTDVDPNKDATSISGHFRTGEKSGKITGAAGSFEQTVPIHAGSTYELRAHIKGPGTIGVVLDGSTVAASSQGDGESWLPVIVPFDSGAAETMTIFGAHNGDEGRFDDFELVALSGPALAAAEEAAKGPKVYATIPDGCSRMSQLRVRSVTDDGTHEDIHGPENATDHRFDPDSRWSSKGAGKALILDMGMPQTLKELGVAWYKGDARQSFFDVATSTDGTAFRPLIDKRSSDGLTTAIERYDFDDTIARYIRLTGYGNQQNTWNSVVEIQPYGCGFGEIASTGDGTETARVRGVSAYGLKLGVPPSENFDLTRWKITIPVDRDGDGRADEISETDLAAGWQDDAMFYTDPVTGGMVFRSTPAAAATTPNSSYARVELRGMLRAGDDSIPTRTSSGKSGANNWVFSSAPAEAQANAGGVDGTLRATLAVNQVSRMGERGQVGRVVIGQIHGRDDEPIRLYYRKLPTNKFGSIYYAHEIAGGDDIYVEMIGSRSGEAENPADGIALDEVFSYEIAVTGDEVDGVVHPILTVKIIRDDGTEVVAPPLDMIDSGYSTADEFMFFKAGAYSQNNTSTWAERDVDQVTFFALEAMHN
ncbi:MAG: polysaccharide lyase family 7 protein [Pseudomonadota bacterium]